MQRTKKKKERDSAPTKDRMMCFADDVPVRFPTCTPASTRDSFSFSLSLLSFPLIIRRGTDFVSASKRKKENNIP